MKQSGKSTTSGGGKQTNDPRKNDPTKQDERDNDATRIRPEKDNKEKPATPPEPGGSGINEGVEEPSKQPPYKRTPANKPEPVEEPGKQKGGINKAYNPAAPDNKQNDTNEKDDSGNPVLKRYGKGL
jgi:hypothetical protein